ncbi:hypothetical protein [Acetobacter musti]|uniref:hypothetical protein n=1 Tax=Acetobacter musti TaxID=864732 RepID=UPI001F557453|nr:hypothetical protein [Acetobacter musti]
MSRNLLRITAILLSGLTVTASDRVYAAATREFNDYAGVVGELPIGMTLSVSGSRIAEGSHYYYRKYLKDIPLTGTAGTDLRLTEPGGGLFVLHYVDNKSASVTPENSTGLEGTWTGNGRTIPVRLSAESAGPYVPGHRYSEITEEDDAKFEFQVKGFYNAAISGRHADAARFVAFPLRVNTDAGRYMMVHNAAELQQKWDRIFSPAWLKALAEASPHDLFVTNGQAMIGAGLAFFGQDGLEVVNAAP